MFSNNNLPKVLIVGNFNQKTANGITIKNLFRYWPCDKVAVADYLSTKEEMMTPTINEYYKIGNEEYKFSFPLNIIKKPAKSESFKYSEISSLAQSSKSSNEGLSFKVKLIINTIQLFFLQKTGLFLVSKQYQISKDFDKWITEFDPEIIYSTVGDISNMNLILLLAERYQKRLVFHIFDDFLNSKPRQTFLSRYWQRRMDKTFRSLLDKTELNLVISEKMAFEYEKKYQKKFYAFHNPITEKIWLNRPVSKIQKNNKNVFTFVFTGAVLEHTAPTLKDFIFAINTLKNIGIQVNLNIYTPTSYSEVIRLIGIDAKHYFKGFIPNDQVPDKIHEADATLLTLSFKKSSIKYTRLSMATKVTEYMISGKPILLFAPSELAVTEYLKENEAGFIITSKEELIDGIRIFVQNEEMRKRISENAVTLAKRNHLSENVNQRFYNLLTTLKFEQ